MFPRLVSVVSCSCPLRSRGIVCGAFRLPRLSQQREVFVYLGRPGVGDHHHPAPLARHHGPAVAKRQASAGGQGRRGRGQSARGRPSVACEPRPVTHPTLAADWSAAVTFPCHVCRACHPHVRVPPWAGATGRPIASRAAGRRPTKRDMRRQIVSQLAAPAAPLIRAAHAWSGKRAHEHAWATPSSSHPPLSPRSRLKLFAFVPAPRRRPPRAAHRAAAVPVRRAPSSIK